MSSVQFLFPDSEAVRALQPDPALSAREVRFLTKRLPEKFRIEQREKLSRMDRFWAFLGQRNWRTVRIETKEGTKLVYFDVRNATDRIGNVFFRAYPCTGEERRKNVSDFNVDGLRKYIGQWAELEGEEEALAGEIRERMLGGISLHLNTVQYLTKNFSLQVVERPSFFQKIRGRWVPIRTTEGARFLNVHSIPSSGDRERFSRDEATGYLSTAQNTAELRSYFISSVRLMRPSKYSDSWYRKIAEDENRKLEKHLSPAKVANQ